MSAQRQILLADYKTSPDAKSFSGRPRGEYCRTQLRLDDADINGDEVRIIVPDDTYMVNLSFFLGLFGPSVRTLGRDRFYRQYQFKAQPHIERLLPRYVDEALNETVALPEKKTA